MTSVRFKWLLLGLACWSLGLVAGCGKSNSAPATSASETLVANEEESSTRLPLLALPGPKPAANKNSKPDSKAAVVEQAAPKEIEKKLPEPEKGSPEWLLREIQRIKASPLPGYEQKSEAARKAEELKEEDPEKELEDEPEKVLTAAEEQAMKEQFEKTKAVRRERSLQIIKLAELCIAATAKKPESEGLFDAGVHYLMDARLQLALQGDATSIEAVYDAAKAFYGRNPESVSAVESQLTLVNLTHAYAIRYGESQPKWLQEFAKQSQLYASRFPEESQRSVLLLAAAARSCEVAGLTAEATSCYSLLLTNFEKTAEAQQAKGVVRRLQLKGKTLELAGPTMEGDDLNIESYRGKMVVVVFWATHAKPFVDQLPKLQATLKKYEKYSSVIGVSMDADANAIEAFAERSGMTWPQILSPNRALRGWNSPLAVHYGINSLPTIWLVDPNGVVVDTSINAENLASRMHEVYLPFLKAANKPEGNVKPTSGTK